MDAFFVELLTRMHENIPETHFAVKFWDDRLISFGEEPFEFFLHIKAKEALKRILADGYLGFGESYMQGLVEVEGNLQRLLEFALRNEFDNARLSRLQKLKFIWNYFLSRNSLRRAPKNITHHYDRGNDFYALWLDTSMTYSCAYFQHPDDDLGTAQKNKYEHICRKLMLQEGETLIDVGCGWGGMLFYAARNYGVKATGCTLSRNQYDYVRDKVKALGLEKMVTVLYEDYRNITGKFDKFVSIGMFEHVGKQFIPDFMKKTRALLKEEGLGLLHTIGKDVPAPPDPWTLKYIFPGGYIPALSEIVQGMGNVGFSVLDVENLRMHYALTLEKWAQNFEGKVDIIRNMFDERFVRMWRLFLNGSAAGFKWGNSRLFQVTFSNGINNRLPLTRGYIYRKAKESYLEFDG